MKVFSRLRDYLQLGAWPGRQEGRWVQTDVQRVLLRAAQVRAQSLRQSEAGLLVEVFLRRWSQVGTTVKLTGGSGFPP